MPSCDSRDRSVSRRIRAGAAHECSLDRRQFINAGLKVAGATVLAGGLAGYAPRARSQGVVDHLLETDLGDGLVQISGAGGNVVLLGGASGVVLVDSGSAEHEQLVLSAIRKRFGGAPVQFLINTHWHLDHTGGNDAIGRAGARIIAHENTRLWMSTEFYVDWEERTYSPRSVEARPTETFRGSNTEPTTLDHAGRQIEYGLLREAHTDGDLYVRFPEQNVIVAGGAVTVGEYPVLDYVTGGLIEGLIRATQRLIRLSDADTRIVPAVGAVQRRAHLEAQRDMLSTVLERVEKMGRQGKSVEEMLAAGITKDFDASWGTNAKRFLTNVYDSLWALGR
jgi:cyclase